MSYIVDHKAKFDNLKVSLGLKNREQLKRSANGGNSILFLYPPNEESLYIEKAKEIFDNDRYTFIDLSKLFVEYIEKSSLNSIERKYLIFKATPHKVFIPFKEFIIETIKNVNSKNMTPILIRSGVLYGTGIENLNLMEDKTVMGLDNPLVLFYPAKLENDNLYFLNFKLASKYRCTVIK
jgi:hypothetical protein